MTRRNFAVGADRRRARSFALGDDATPVEVPADDISSPAGAGEQDTGRPEEADPARSRRRRSFAVGAPRRRSFAVGDNFQPGAQTTSNTGKGRGEILDAARNAWRPPEATGRRAQSHLIWLAIYIVALAAAFIFVGVNLTLAVIAGALNFVFLLFFFRHLAFAVAAARWTGHDLTAADVDLVGFEPTVAVLVGAKNEELVIDGLVSSLLALDYAHDAMEIIIVDDASSDRTGAMLDAWALRDSRLRVIHRPEDAGGGKSGALNEALATTDADIVVVFDADHEPEPTALRRLVRHFRDPHVGAVMGRCVIRNGLDSSLASTVFMDFLSGYLVNEYGRQALFELPAYGGANCAVRTRTVKALGGWNPDSVTEDTDITLRVIAAGQRVRYDVTAVDFEEAAESLRKFLSQRYRWSRGHQQCFRDYWKPLMASSTLSFWEKAETMMFLLVYHVPVLCFLGILLTLLRVFGVGGLPVFDVVPLSMLLFIGPLAELSVGLIQGRVQRRSAWRLIGFLPAFALSIYVTTRAYIDGMLGRSYTWAKTGRSGSLSTVAASDAAGPVTVHEVRRPTLPGERLAVQLRRDGLDLRSGAGHLIRIAPADTSD